MKIYDISQEVFNCEIYPGDPSPERTVLSSIENGDAYNLTAFSMCAHNGTHIDAPAHFISDGKTVEQIELSSLVGYAFVAEHDGPLTREDAIAILKRARGISESAAERILIKGKIELSFDGAEVFAQEKIKLFGTELQTVGSKDAPMHVHRLLLGEDIVLLEGIRLSDVSEGVYLLNAAPLSLGGAEGAPCRAILMNEN